MRRAQTGETNGIGEGKGGKRRETDGYFIGKGPERGRQMRMRLLKGDRERDRWVQGLEEGQRVVTDGIKDDKRVRKRE